MKLIFGLTLLVLMYAAPSWAQRRVGNGGGFAEMKMIYLFETLELYLASCQNSQNSCALTGIEQNQVREIAVHLTEQRRGAGLQFEHGIEGDMRLGQTWGQPVILDSQALYTSEGLAKPLSELGELLIKALIHHSKNPQNSDLGFKVFHDLREMVVTVRSKKDLLHSLTLSRGTMKSGLLVYETPERSIDITGDVLPMIPCAQVRDLEIERLNAENELFIVNLAWSCATDDKPSTGILIIESPERMRLVSLK